MSKIINIFLLLFLINLCDNKPSNERFDLVAIKKDRGICAVQLSTKMERCFELEGDRPCLSADGTKIAYTKYGDSTNNYARCIYIFDINKAEESRLNVNSENFYGPTWSPDNKHIAFMIFLGHTWQIGVINCDNTHWNVLRSDQDLYLPTWTQDGQNIITFDFDKLYRFDLEGKLLETIDIKSLLGLSILSSETKFYFTSDNKYLVWNGGTDESVKVEGHKEPVEGIFSYEIATKSRKQLTPKGMEVGWPFLDVMDEVYFSGGFPDRRSQYCIYKINLKDNSLKLVLENAFAPSCRNFKYIDK
jgi:TolB protein